jgi:Flp pilus assembly protein TadD
MLGMHNYRNEHEDAVQAFKTVIKLDPTHFNARYSLGFTYEKLGKLELAEIEYKRYQSLKKRFESMTTKE